MGPTPPSDRPPGRDRAAVALLAALLGTVWAVAVPPFMGPDEPWHLERGELAAAGERASLVDATPQPLSELPSSPAQVAARYPAVDPREIGARQERLVHALIESRWFERVDWAEDPGRARSFDVIHPSITAAHQPPAYYVVLGAWLRLCPFEAPAARVRFARTLSVAAYVALALAALAAGHALAGPEVGRLSAAALLLAPPSTRFASTVSNDVGAALVGALAILAWLAHERRPTGVRASLVLGCVAAASWIKPTAFGLVALAPPLVIRAGHRLRLDRRLLGLFGLLALGLMIGALALHRSPVLPASLDALRTRLEAGLSAEAWAPVLIGLAGSSNWDSRLPPAWTGALLAGLALLGWIGAGRLVRRRPLSFAPRIALSLALLAAAQLALIALRGAGAARYLLPAAPAFAALAALGWFACVGGQTRVARLARVLLLTALIAWQASALIGGVWLEERVLLGR